MDPKNNFDALPDEAICFGCGREDGHEGPCMPEELPAEGDDSCPECGAPAGMPCDPRCPNAEQAGPDPDRYREGVGFDKFMDKILIQEGHNRKVTKQDDSPQRRRQAARQERPLGRIRIGGK